MSYWDAIAAYLGYRAATSNQDPKVTNVPLTPEQQWLFGVMKDYLSNPSQERQAANSYNLQMLQGLGKMGTPKPTYASPFMQGPFAGGIQAPKIDLSRYTSTPWKPTTTTVPGGGGANSNTPPNTNTDSPGVENPQNPSDPTGNGIPDPTGWYSPYGQGFGGSMPNGWNGSVGKYVWNGTKWVIGQLTSPLDPFEIWKKFHQPTPPPKPGYDNGGVADPYAGD